MRDADRARREAEIAAAAYRLLEEKGPPGLSMLAVAKAARASNETLYRWYGDKAGLFRALAERNAAEARAALEAGLPVGGLDAALGAFGPRLLRVLVGPRAVALNRAAAADPTGALGDAIARGGREAIRPRLEAIMGEAAARGELGGLTAPTAADLYLRLLIGDWQIRRVIGTLPEPGAAEIAARAEEARTALRRLSGG